LQVSGWFLTATAGVEATGAAEEHGASRNEEPLPVPGSGAGVNVQEALKDVFGYDSFRPLQEEIIQALLQRRNTLAVMPTGAGKSLCYQLPATIWPQLTVVVSPLISLMQDQVEALHTLRVPAAYLNSTLTYAEQRRLMDHVRAGQVKLLYMAPETLLRPEVLHLLDQVGVACLAVDEAHCISAWGHNFRPEYRQLEPVRRRFGSAVCLAMTATAAPRVRADIKKSLGIEDAGEIVASFDRPNLFLSAQLRTNGEQQLLTFLEEHREQPGIIYCTSRNQVEALAERLRRRGYSVLPYHGGMDDGARQRNQRAFTRDEVQIIVATIAFGMGINKPNVRFVVHYNMPASVEAYYQEIGRSGRDGLRADCLLLYHMQDMQVHARMIADDAEEERPGRNARLQAMLRFAQAHTCRRPLLLHYFGEETAETTCGFCDNCTAQADVRPQMDVTEAAQKFLACMLRTGEVFGASHIIDVLRGSQNRKVIDRRHDTLPMYGAGKEHSAAQWRTYVQQWLQQQLLEQDMEHGSLRLTPWGREVLRGERPAYAEPQAAHAPSSSREGADGRAGVTMPDYDTELFEQLRGLRRELAQGSNLPPYMVFSDRALAEMAAYLPRTPEEFIAINGVGRAKLETYGETFIAAIATYSATHNLQPQPRPKPSSLPQASPSMLSPTMPKTTAVLPAEQRAGKRSGQVGELFAAGATLGMLQESFGIKRSTVISHLRDYLLDGGTLDGGRLHAECDLPAEVQEKVWLAFAELGRERLAPVYEAMGGEVEYDDLHLLRLVWLVQRRVPPAPGGAGYAA
jgi:ATP-dependent DNA helicase RecQ